MPLMQWDETMALGMAELDNQHMTLITLINDTYEAIQRHDEHTLPALISKMKDYANLHFQTEEAILRQVDFPDTKAHAAIHSEFNDKVADFQRKIDTRTNMSQVFIFLSRWLTNHIMVEDRKFLDYLPTDEADQTE